MAGFEYFGAVLTVLFFLLGSFLKKRLHSSLLNPILFSSVVLIILLMVTGLPYEDYHHSASIISWFLTPATVSLAVPLYDRITVLKNNWKAVAVGILTGVLTTVVCVWIICLLFGTSHEFYVSMLPKGITAALGKPLCEEFGGVVAITLTAIMITGILGNVSCVRLLALFRIDEPVARGLAIGTCSHAIGTTKALEIGPTEGAASSLAIVLAGILTVILAPQFVQLL